MNYYSFTKSLRKPIRMEPKEEAIDKLLPPDDTDNWSSDFEMGYSQIEKHLYMSGYAFVEDLDRLKEMDIKYVLSVFDDDLRQKSDEITYMKIDATDYIYQDLLTRFHETNQFISNAQNSGQNVVVHCHAGISRSATIVLAFIMKKHELTFESALAFVRRNRKVYPNEGFSAQLKLYHEMGYTMNANNRLLRRHLIKSLLTVGTLLTTIHINKIQEYFRRIDMAQEMTKNLELGTDMLDLGQKCLCVKCDHHLFNEIHIFRTDIEEGDPHKICEWTFIEPQKWMKQLYEPFEGKNEFVVKCPECHEEVIQYKRQFMQYWCECYHHRGLCGTSLRFRISNQKFKFEAKD